MNAESNRPERGTNDGFRLRGTTAVLLIAELMVIGFLCVVDSFTFEIKPSLGWPVGCYDIHSICSHSFAFFARIDGLVAIADAVVICAILMATYVFSETVLSRLTLQRRFTLRTLLLLVVLAGSCMGLSTRWNAWEILYVLEGHRGLVNDASYSPDGRMIVTGSADSTARVWSAADGEVLSVLSGHLDEVTGVSFDPDSRRVAAAAKDSTVRIWDAMTGNECLCIDTGMQVDAVRFSSDGTRLQTFGAGETRMWNVRDGKPMTDYPYAGTWCRPLSPPRMALFLCGTQVLVKEQLRPDAWWGLLVVPETWLAIIAMGALIWTARPFVLRTES